MIAKGAKNSFPPLKKGGDAHGDIRFAFCVLHGADRRCNAGSCSHGHKKEVTAPRPMVSGYF